jgi:hypothetical protein
MKDERAISLFKNAKNIFENDMFWKDIENDFELSMNDWFEKE